MNKKDYYLALGIDPAVIKQIEQSEKKINTLFEAVDHTAELNQLKVLKAFQENRISDMHFQWHTGYGYDDPGREATEKVYASIFNTEDAIVRPLIVNGTHALTLCLTGLLKPGDELMAITGAPYDTLHPVIGINHSDGYTLRDIGVQYKEIELLDNGGFDKKRILSELSDKTSMVYIQRSAGYSFRKALVIDDLEDICKDIKAIYPNVIIMVDNCYGEFIELKEPTDVGADLMAGSLIKNPGGGIALSGGYIVGNEKLIERISYRMTSPGIGKECGLTFGQTRSILQGLFLAPTTVASALKGAILCSQVYEDLGFEVKPKPNEQRSDIIQSVKLSDSDKVIKFCQGVQSAAPIDAFVTPEPWDMPGYNDPVIMAAGAFVQGSSIELSADAPIRAPYAVYFQGGLTYPHSKFGVIKSLDNLYKNKLIEL